MLRWHFFAPCLQDTASELQCTLHTAPLWVCIWLVRGKKDCYIGHSGWIIQIDDTQSLNIAEYSIGLNINHLPYSIYVTKAAANRYWDQMIVAISITHSIFSSWFLQSEISHLRYNQWKLGVAFDFMEDLRTRVTANQIKYFTKLYQYRLSLQKFQIFKTWNFKIFSFQ